MKYDKERFARAIEKAIRTRPIGREGAAQMADESIRLIESYPKFETALKTIAVKLTLAAAEGKGMNEHLDSALGALEAVFMLGMWVREEMEREEKEERNGTTESIKPIEVV